MLSVMGDRSLTCTHDLYKEKTKKEKITMKKTYMTPTLQVVKIQVANLLQTISGGFGIGTQSGGSAATRRARFSDFDDEWDEE